MRDKYEYYWSFLQQNLVICDSVKNRRILIVLWNFSDILKEVMCTLWYWHYLWLCLFFQNRYLLYQIASATSDLSSSSASAAFPSKTLLIFNPSQIDLATIDRRGRNNLQCWHISRLLDDLLWQTKIKSDCNVRRKNMIFIMFGPEIFSLKD